MNRSLSFGDKTRTVVITLTLSILLLLLASCKDNKETRQRAERVINVSVSVVEKKTVRPSLDATGTLYPFDEAIVSAEVDGVIKRVYVEEGRPVSKGMLIAEIDETDFGLELKRAEAQLRQAEVTLTNTKTEYERKKALLKDELITKQQYDDVKTRLDLAEAELQKARASLNLAKQRLSKTKVYATLTGYVKTKKVTTGDFVRTGGQLFTLIKNDPIKLVFSINERDIAKVKVNQEVSFNVETLPAKEFKARVYTIYPNLDEKLRTLTIEARASNEAGLLKPGLFAKVTVYTDAPKDTLLIPSTAVLYEANTMKVYTIEGDKAKMKIIKTGAKYGDMVEVTEGLTEGERVVVVGQQNLSDGVKVHVAR